VAEAAARRGVAGALLLIAVAMAVPKVFGWHVHALHIAPLVASWRPRIGPGTLPAIALGAAAVWWGPRLAAALSWPRLAAVAYAAGVAWQVSLATVDGWGGIGHILNHHDEYLPTARGVTDISAALHDWIDRIPLHSAHHWPVHVAGHPPGALLFFVLLDRIGLGSGLAAGWVVMLIAATTPVAVLLTLRRLGAADAARNVAPLLVIGPAAIWTAVSADAVFAAVGAWALCCLAYSATSLTRIGTIAAGLGAGLLLGYCVLLSYGLPILGLLALGVLVVARTARPLPWLIAGTAAVMLAFAAAGFAWWDALPVLRRRYYAGIAARRPAAYWVWGDLAALCISAGPAVGASVAVVLTRLRQRIEPVVALALAALSCIVVADLSFMSKAEVERIWLPFVPWLLLGLALLPATWRRYAFAGQVVFALLVQSLFGTHW
jgi:hypothetical protein